VRSTCSNFVCNESRFRLKRDICVWRARSFSRTLNQARSRSTRTTRPDDPKSRNVLRLMKGPAIRASTIHPGPVTLSRPWPNCYFLSIIELVWPLWEHGLAFTAGGVNVQSEIAEEPCGQYQCMPDAHQGMATPECNIVVTIWSAPKTRALPRHHGRVLRAVSGKAAIRKQRRQDRASGCRIVHHVSASARYLGALLRRIA
jgi:hypothetical protein